MVFKVGDPTNRLMMSGDSMTRGVVEQPAWSIMQTQGAVIDVSQVQTKVQGLTRALISDKKQHFIPIYVYCIKTGWLCESPY